MYDNWSVNLLVVAVTALAVALCVAIHYEGLVWLSGKLQRLDTTPRRKVLYGVYAVFALHIVEIWLFGLALWGLLRVRGSGAMVGAAGPHLFDVIYLSASTFTTIGFGDITLSGPARFLCGTEGLIGLILITWSASFLYLEMERFWRAR
jgi:Ion channel